MYKNILFISLTFMGIIISARENNRNFHAALVPNNSTRSYSEQTRFAKYNPKIRFRKDNHALVRSNLLTQSRLDIPPRSSDAVEGSEFMESIKNMSFSNREDAILNELLAGNIPNFLRELVEIEATFNDANNNSHQVKYWVMPDYLAIGSDSNFCRVPMGPITAQKAADVFGACMPTRKLVDNIYQNAEIKLAPVTYNPDIYDIDHVAMFIEHNNAIQAQFNATEGVLGQLVGGIKKDVVLSNKIIDPSRPNHVVIYGWHQLNGNPIQPLTNIHGNYYVDYSHGIRLLDSDVLIDGDSTTVAAILQDEILYKVLSDEAEPMYYPTYIFEIKVPPKPASFGVKSEYEGQLKVLLKPDSTVLNYNLYLSLDGVNFGPTIPFDSDEFVFGGLPPDSAIFIRLTAENSFGKSRYSEVLAVLPRPSERPKMLLVNGFDRSSDGNTYNFCRQHASAIINQNISFDAATNEALTDGLFTLEDYPVVDYILGDESTADETFSNTEQNLVKEFLKKGGCLFVSGSEIAWDLDYQGSVSDKAFIYEYLKAQYSADAPGGVSGVYYVAEGVSGELFEELTEINFDDGTHGTIDVKYADALLPQDGAKEIIRYQDVSNHNIGGIQFEGTFGTGTIPGKLIYLGVPFETIYPAYARNLMMGKILTFLYPDGTALDRDVRAHPEEFLLAQNYPNPFNPQTTIRFRLPQDGNVKLEVYSSSGAKVATLVNKDMHRGYHKIKFNAENLSSGIYFYRLQADSHVKTQKMVLMK